MIQKHEVSNVGKLIFIQLNNVSEEKFVSAFFNIKETLNAGRTRFSVINDEGLWTWDSGEGWACIVSTTCTVQRPGLWTAPVRAIYKWELEDLTAISGCGCVCKLNSNLKENIFTGLKSFRVHYMYGLKVSNKIFVTRWARQIFADSGSVCIHTTGGNFPIPDFLLWMSAEAAQPAGRREEIW